MLWVGAADEVMDTLRMLTASGRLDGIIKESRGCPQTLNPMRTTLRSRRNWVGGRRQRVSAIRSSIRCPCSHSSCVAPP